MKGGCHCGAVTLATSSNPEYVNLCDCSLCLKQGGAWGYYSKGEVEVSGSTSSYRRTDYDEPAVEVHFCPTCGTTTHWVLTEHFEGDRVGVNVRIFEPSELDGVEARTLDGRNWNGDSPVEHRRSVGFLGKDVFL